MSQEKFSSPNNRESLRILSDKEISEGLHKLREAKMFDVTAPGHILIEEDAACHAMYEYLSTGNLDKALDFFSSQ